MPKITDPSEVKYLAFEGGGGKGVTYLGAVKALEDLGVLPIDHWNPIEQRKSPIKGVSGSSAGAITALMLVLGYDYKELKAILSKPEPFLAFFDPKPSIGLLRSVDRDGSSTIHRGTRDTGLSDLIRPSYSLIIYPSLVSWKLEGILAAPLSLKYVATLLKNPQYLHNILFDGGVFPGFGVRAFFHSFAQEDLSEPIPIPFKASPGTRFRPLTFPPRRKKGSEFPPFAPGIPLMLDKKQRVVTYKTQITPGTSSFQLFTFQALYELTGIDLVVTGTNVSKGIPGIFSRWHTPDFPVLEAVAISMNIPFVWKPVYVDIEVPREVRIGNHTVECREPTSYQGFWVDGGFLNNIPIHAFDPTTERSIAEGEPFPLNPGMLAFRLVEDRPDVTIAPGFPQASDLSLKNYLMSVLRASRYPAGEGQIRSAEEREQTIDLHDYGIETLDLTPSKDKAIDAQQNAYEKVRGYFRGKVSSAAVFRGEGPAFEPKSQE